MEQNCLRLLPAKVISFGSSDVDRSRVARGRAGDTLGLARVEIRNDSGRLLAAYGPDREALDGVPRAIRCGTNSPSDDYVQPHRARCTLVGNGFSPPSGQT